MLGLADVFYYRRACQVQVGRQLIRVDFLWDIKITYTDPLTNIVGGQTVVVGEIASPLAFNLIFAIGIAFAGVIIVVSLFAKNYKFPS